MAKPEHDPQKIVKSQAFAAINLLIDQRLDSLLRWQATAKDRMTELLTPQKSAPYKATIDTKVHEEGGERTPLLFDSPMLKQLAEIIAMAAADEVAIKELVRFKLHLLNDYDFTHGNAAEQIAIFGEPSNG